MDHKVIIEFFTISVPEEIFMALLAWAILGKKETVKLFDVVTAGLILAVAFMMFYVVFYPNLTLLSILQVATFILVVYFIYKLNYIEAIVGSLLTLVIVAVIQAALVNIGLALTGYTYDDYNASIILKSLVAIPEYIVMALLSFLLYKQNIKLLNLGGSKKKEPDKIQQNKVRYLVLQLSFALLVIIVNYSLFVNNKIFFEGKSIDKTLIVINFLVIIIFTLLVVKGAFKMGVSIRKEEESRRRKLDGREIIQNIDYLCKLMDSKEYGEVESILKSMKNEVDRDMVNND